MISLCWLGLFAGFNLGQEPEPVDFASQVLPILKQHCFSCHASESLGGPKKAKAGLRLDGAGWILAGAKGDQVLVPGKPEESSLWSMMALPADDPDIMPAKGDPASAEEIALIRQWIEEGASFGDWRGEAGGLTIRKGPAPDQPVSVMERMAKNLEPASQAQIKKAAGDKARITPVRPGSPLLHVEFPHKDRGLNKNDLQRLQSIAPWVAILDLSRLPLKEEVLGQLPKLPRLIRLEMRSTGLDDRGLAALPPLAELRVCNLFGNPIGNASVKKLLSFPQLRVLYLWKTEITEAGVDSLRKDRAKLQVHWNPKFPAPRNPASD
ncbi:MAG: hypothetical protein DWQ01_16755 [Planctomycetota bacterium]|nr:MAG: hypothetical protein DWQ01_16755 [Planctomycetota bacterium]